MIHLTAIAQKWRQSAIAGCLAAVLSLGFLAFGPAANAAIDLGWEQMDTPYLPPSIQVFKSTQPYPNGNAVKAYYSVIDLTDPNLEIDVIYPGQDGAPSTPLAEMKDSEEPAYVATNGSFYNTSNFSSSNPVVDDGEILAYGQQGQTKNGQVYYPTWGIWGLNAERKSEIVWAWPSPGDNAFFVYDKPYPNSLLELPLPVPSLTPPFQYSPDGQEIPQGRIWDAVEALGGIPALIKNGELLPVEAGATDNCATAPTAEYCNEMNVSSSFSARNPRTAIGVSKDGNKIYLLVIDGRSIASVGATLRETAEVLQGIGAYDGLNLDGGGSSSITVNNFDGVLEAPASGNGDNSSDVLNTPSDGYMRAVASSLIIKRRPLYFDADPAASGYAETDGAWSASTSTEAYPDSDSPTRLTPAVGSGQAPTAEAVFALNGIAPAEYEVSAWWSANANNATNAPFTIERNGFDPVTVRRDQTGSTSQFNTLGNFHLSTEDVIRLTNNADGGLVAIDALRLRRVGESVPAVSLGSSSTVNTVSGGRIAQTVTITSPNTGVKPAQIAVYKSVDGGAETLVDTMDYSGANGMETYGFSYVVTESANTQLNFRFQVKDNLSHVVSTNLTVNVLDFDFQINPVDPTVPENPGNTLEFNIDLSTGTPALTMQNLAVYVSRNGGEQKLYKQYTLSGSSGTVPFSYFINDFAGDELTVTFVVTTSDGAESETSYVFDVEPAKGDFSIGFISDMNGSYGSTTYDSRVTNAVGFLVDQGVDAVISAGDMVAGQCSTSTSCDEPAMWAGFDNALYSQLKDASIPFLFTLQNHDAGTAWDLEAANAFWTDSANIPQGASVTMVDDTDYPRNYSAVLDFDSDGQADIFFVSVFNPGDDLNAAELAFLDEALQSPQAQNARLRMVDAGQPLYAISAPRNSAGFVTGPRDAIASILRDRNVDIFVSGDSAAYYPGKRFNIKLLALGEMGGGGKAYIGESQVPPSTITRADIFVDNPYYGKNAVVLTTYDLQNDMAIVRRETLPMALFGFDNHFVMREDVPVAEAGATTLSSMNLSQPFASAATGDATLTVENGTVTISGQFSGLESNLLGSFDAVALYVGRNGVDGELLQTLDVQSSDSRSGSFSASFAQTPEVLDSLAIGNYYVQIKTAAHPQGALRGQLFNAQTSNAPKAPSFTGIDDGTVSVRDLPSLLEVHWTEAEDEEKSPVTYTYQLSTSDSFAAGDLLVDAFVGRSTIYQGLTQAEWLEFLNGEDQAVLYQRVIASDGQNVVVGAARQIVLTRETTPLDGQVTVSTPNFEYKGIFATLGAGFRVYDVAIDEATGRIWANNYSHGPYAFNADGTVHVFSAPGIGYGVDGYGNQFINYITFNGATFNDGTCYGVEYDPDGYVLVATGNGLFKLDAYTGKPVAHWSGTGGFGSNPSIADDGTIFGNYVFPGTASYIIKASTTNPGAFDLVRLFNSSNPPQLSLSGEVARSSAYSPEGDRIYLPPTSSSPYVSVYAKEGDDWVRLDDYEMPAPTGSDAAYAGPGHTMWVVNEKSSFPPNLIYVDFDQQLTWNLYLEDIEESDLRALTVSRDGKTVYIGGAAAIYKYQIAEDGTPEEPALISLSQACTVDSDGESTRLDQQVRVQAVVTTGNLSADGLEFYGEDASDHVKFFASTPVDGYTPEAGDKIEVTGTVTQVLGQLYIMPQSVQLLGKKNALRVRPLVAEVGEEQESQIVTISGLSLAEASEWSNSGFVGFGAQADGTACGVNNAGSINLFIAKGTDLYNNPAPEGCFSVTGVVQQNGGEYIVTPLSTQDVALEGQVTTTMMTKFQPATSDRVTFTAKAGRALGRVSTSAYSWYRNGLPVVPKGAWETVTGRFYATRNLNSGDVLTAHVTSSKSVYPYTSMPLTVGMSPRMVADSTDNAPGEGITITYEANSDWADSIENVVLVTANDQAFLNLLGTENHVPEELSKDLPEAGTVVSPDLYTVYEDRIEFEPGVFGNEGIYTVLVYGEGYRLDQVEQTIRTLSPELTADGTGNDLLNNIAIYFEDNDDWEAAVNEVLINDVSLAPSDYSLGQAYLVINAGVFPGVGEHTVTVKATGFTDRVVTQSIVLSTPPALIADSTGNTAGNAIQIGFAANPIWQGFVSGVVVNNSALANTDYTVGNGILTLQPGVLNQARDYLITVEADNFDDVTVIQPVLAQ